MTKTTFLFILPPPGKGDSYQGRQLISLDNTWAAITQLPSGYSRYQGLPSTVLGCSLSVLGGLHLCTQTMVACTLNESTEMQNHQHTGLTIMYKAETNVTISPPNLHLHNFRSHPTFILPNF